MSRRVPSLRCHINSARSALGRSLPFRFFAMRDGSSPCPSVALRFMRGLAKLLRSISNQAARCVSASNPHVSSQRPSFPQLRRSAQIPSLPCRVFSPLIYSVAARLDAILCLAIQPLLDALRSRPIAASPSPWWSVPSCAIPPLLPCASFFALPWLLSAAPFQSISARVVSWCLAAMPFHCQASHFHSFRLHAPPSQLWSRQSLSIPPPFRRGSCHNQSQRLHLHSQRPSSIRCPVNSTGRVAHRLRICACLRAAFPFAAMPLPNLSELCNTMSNQCFAPRISPLLRRIESSPLQSAPSRFRTSLLLSKQGRSFPLPLVSRRFRLCSALPYQILESRLQALPWLLVAFYGWAIPFLFGSLRLRWPRFQIGSFRLLSQPRHCSAMPIWANRFSAAPSHIVSPRFDTISSQIRSRPSISKPCPFDSTKSGLITSVAFRVRSV